MATAYRNVTAPDTAPAAGCQVLIVEDEPLIRLSTAAAFADAGFTVWQATSVDEALDALRHHPDITVIFSDVNLAGMRNGVDLALEAKRCAPQALVILTSGRGMPPDFLPRDGCFVPKPYQLDQVVRVIRGETRRLTPPRSAEDPNPFNPGEVPPPVRRPGHPGDPPPAEPLPTPDPV